MIILFKHRWCRSSCETLGELQARYSTGLKTPSSSPLLRILLALKSRSGAGELMSGRLAPPLDGTLDSPITVVCGTSVSSDVGSSAADSGSCLFGITLVGLAGPCVKTSDCLRCSSSSLATGSQSSCFGTPSAPGRSPKASLSSPQKLGRRTGAGVTGRLGRSISVGKSVSFMLGRRGCEVSSAPGERRPSATVESFVRTWTLALRFCARLEM